MPEPLSERLAMWDRTLSRDCTLTVGEWRRLQADVREAAHFVQAFDMPEGFTDEDDTPAITECHARLAQRPDLPEDDPDYPSFGWWLLWVIGVLIALGALVRWYPA